MKKIFLVLLCVSAQSALTMQRSENKESTSSHHMDESSTSDYSSYYSSCTDATKNIAPNPGKALDKKQQPQKSKFFHSGTTESTVSDDEFENNLRADETLDDNDNTSHTTEKRKHSIEEDFVPSPKTAMSPPRKQQDMLNGHTNKHGSPTKKAKTNSDESPERSNLARQLDGFRFRTPSNTRLSNNMLRNAALKSLHDEDNEAAPNVFTQTELFSTARRNINLTNGMHIDDALKSLQDDDDEAAPHVFTQTELFSKARSSQSPLSQYLSKNKIAWHKNPDNISSETSDWYNNIKNLLKNDNNIEEALTLITQNSCDASPSASENFHDLDHYSKPYISLLGHLYAQTKAPNLSQLQKLPIPMINFHHIYTADYKGYHSENPPKKEDAPSETIVVTILFDPASQSSPYGGSWKKKDANGKFTTEDKFSSFFNKEHKKNDIAKIVKNAFFNQIATKYNISGNGASASKNTAFYEALGYDHSTDTYIEMYVGNHIEVQAHPIIAYINLARTSLGSLIINERKIAAAALRLMAQEAIKKEKNLRYTNTNNGTTTYIIDIGENVAFNVCKNIQEDQEKHAKSIYVEIPADLLPDKASASGSSNN